MHSFVTNQTFGQKIQHRGVDFYLFVVSGAKLSAAAANKFQLTFSLEKERERETKKMGPKRQTRIREK